MTERQKRCWWIIDGRKSLRDRIFVVIFVAKLLTCMKRFLRLWVMMLVVSSVCWVDANAQYIEKHEGGVAKNAPLSEFADYQRSEERRVGKEC